MKLTYEANVLIFLLRKQGYNLDQLSNKFGLKFFNLSYMIICFLQNSSSHKDCKNSFIGLDLHHQRFRLLRISYLLIM